MILSIFLTSLFCTIIATEFSEGSFGPCQPFQNFPSGIILEVFEYESYIHDFKVPFAYKATPEFPEDITLICNWAFEHGYRVRAKGNGHNWSPFLFSLSERTVSCPKVILVDMMKHFTSIKLNPSDDSGLKSVTVGTGVILLDLLTFLEKNDLGLYASPAMGYLTIGGMLAVGAHGSGVSLGATSLDSKSPGHSYGTMSNLVIEMTLVAWDKKLSSYVLKTLHRSDKDCKAFLVHLGRSFVTKVTLRVGKNQMVRSKSHLFITSQELFGIQESKPKDEEKRTVNSFLKKYGRIDVQEVPFSSFCWVFTWHNEPEKPPESTETFQPPSYLLNYVPTFFKDVFKSLPFELPDATTVATGVLSYPFLIARSVLAQTMDYWGPSKNALIYVSLNSPRVSDSSFVLVTSEDNLQLVLSIAKGNYDMLLKEYAKAEKFPVNVLLNFRITGADDPREIEVPGAEAPILSAASPLVEYPDYKIVVWVQMLSQVGTKDMNEMWARFEQSVFRDLHEKLGIVRPEWSKGWACTGEGPYRNGTVFKGLYPRAFSSSERLEEWNWAVKTMDLYDPHRIFSNEFLDSLLVAYDEK